MYNSNGAVVGTAAGGTLAMTGMTGMSGAWLAVFGVAAIVAGFFVARQIGKRAQAQA